MSDTPFAERTSKVEEWGGVRWIKYQMVFAAMGPKIKN